MGGRGRAGPERRIGETEGEPFALWVLSAERASQREEYKPANNSVIPRSLSRFLVRFLSIGVDAADSCSSKSSTSLGSGIGKSRAESTTSALRRALESPWTARSAFEGGLGCAGSGNEGRVCGREAGEGEGEGEGEGRGGVLGRLVVGEAGSSAGAPISTSSDISSCTTFRRFRGRFSLIGGSISMLTGSIGWSSSSERGSAALSESSASSCADFPLALLFPLPVAAFLCFRFSLFFFKYRCLALVFS